VRHGHGQVQFGPCVWCLNAHKEIVRAMMKRLLPLEGGSASRNAVRPRAMKIGHAENTLKHAKHVEYTFLL
jgi:hypothetical protein